MTSRWPRCTPSKVPTATRRGRGSASGRGTTLALTPGSLRRASGRRPAGRRWPRGRRRRPAGPRRRPPSGAVARARPGRARRARRRRRRARTAGRKASASRAGSDHARGRRRRRRRGRCACAAAPRSSRPARSTRLRTYVPDEHSTSSSTRSPSRASSSKRCTMTSRSGTSTSSPAARALVGAPAADADRAVGRRALAQAAGGQLEPLGDRDAGRGDLALRVARRGHGAEPRDDLVALGQRHEEALDPARAPDEHEQQAGGERVQRARRGRPGGRRARGAPRASGRATSCPRACRRGRGRPRRDAGPPALRRARRR